MNETNEEPTKKKMKLQQHSSPSSPFPSSLINIIHSIKTNLLAINQHSGINNINNNKKDKNNTNDQNNNMGKEEMEWIEHELMEVNEQLKHLNNFLKPVQDPLMVFFKN